VDPTVGVVPLVAAAVGESVGVEVACCPAVSVVGVMEICGTEPCAVAGVAVKNNAARDRSIAATIGILLVNLAPCFMTQFLSYVLYGGKHVKATIAVA
jgi:hypothetical protein